MEITLNKILTDIEGNPDMMSGTEVTMGQSLGKSLVMSASADPITRREWGMVIYSGKPLSVTPAEFDEIRKVCKEMGVSDLYKGQILLELNKQYEEQNKK